MLGFTSGILNALRGKGFLPTILFDIAVGCIVALITLNSVEINLWVHFAACIIGVACWKGGLNIWPFKSGGWGLYFSAFNGHWDNRQKEIKWIDTIGYKIVPFVSTTDFRSNTKRGAICMAIRGAIYCLLLFIYLGFAVSWLALLLWPLMAMQGGFYRAAFWVKEDYDGGLQVSFAEILTVWFLVDLVAFLVIATYFINRDFI